MSVPLYLGLVRARERELADALSSVAQRHDKEPEIRDVGKLLAAWSQEHLEHMKPLLERYGEKRSQDAARLHGALFQGTRVSTLGLLRDLQDLMLLATAVKGDWTALNQAAKELQDKELEYISAGSCLQTERQIKWLKTHIKEISAEALVVPPNKKSELKAVLLKVADDVRGVT